MNDQELKDAISDMQECRELIGKANMRLNNILTQRKADMQKKLDDAYQRGYDQATADISSNEQGIADSAYKSGLNDAWDAARKIVCDEGVDMNTLCTIFRRGCTESIIRDYSASEVIEKLKADDEIKVSDEVIWAEDESVVIVVTRVYTENDVEWCDGVCRNGTVYQILREHARKTGRRFDIESILKGMQS